MRIWLCGCMSTASGWNSCFDAYILALVSDGAPSNLKLSRWLLESLPPNTLLVHHLCDLQLPQEWSCVSVKMGLVGIMMMIHYGSYGSGIGIAIAIADHSCRNQFLFIDSLILWYDITFDMISFWYLKFAGFYKIFNYISVSPHKTLPDRHEANHCVEAIWAGLGLNSLTLAQQTGRVFFFGGGFGELILRSCAEFIGDHQLAIDYLVCISSHII